ncbi:MAG: GNAT family N-acetyltransferase [Planctomycetota bacterium]|nr:GNAT family N-acetyltransferase [Planctomycetota bacterium]
MRIDLADAPATGMTSQSPLSRTYETISLDEWQQFVDNHPQSTPLHHRKWIELLVTQYGFKLFLPAIRSNGQVLAATAFLETRTWLGTRKLISLPFTDCFTPLSYDDQTLCELMDVVRAQRKTGVKTISLRMDKTLRGFPHDQHWVRHRIKLTPEQRDLRPTLAASVKRNLRQAEENGLEYQRRTDLQAIDDFFRLHVSTRRRLGLPVQARSYFHQLQRSIINNQLGFVGLVRSGRTPIAAAVFVQHRGMVVYKYGASDPAALSRRPNDFLFFNAIQSAAHDCHGFDFGVTHLRDQGLRRFKCKWGAVEEPIYDVCIAGDPIGFSGDSRALKLTSAVIRRSPKVLCRALGSAFYRYSP